MGATIFSNWAYGKDAYEAFDYICARAFDGDDEGDLSGVEGFVLVEVPKDIKLSVWLEALESGNLPPALQMHAEEFKRQSEVYNDKDEPVLCFELIEKNPKPGLKKYFFTGCIPD